MSVVLRLRQRWRGEYLQCLSVFGDVRPKRRHSRGISPLTLRPGLFSRITSWHFKIVRRSIGSVVLPNLWFEAREFSSPSVSVRDVNCAAAAGSLPDGGGGPLVLAA